MKKILVLLAIAGAGYYYFGKKNDDAATTIVTPSNPVISGVPGFNADGTVRQLTDVEAQSYLDKNADLVAVFNQNLYGSQGFGTMINFAKAHWFEQGNKEGRQIA